MPDEFYTRERCFMTELLNSPQTPSFSIARCRVEPGVLTELHRLAVDEWYVVESGEGEVRVGDAGGRMIAPGEVVAIPAGISQQIKNTGSGSLLFLCICVPRFTPASYEALEY
jgi:mannose-6-phosphate isomerase-like protein (cupin superfamily)